MHPTLRTPRLRARTVAISDPGPLERYLPQHGGSAFLRRGDGVIGIGEVARFTTDSLDAADIWWSEFVAEIDKETEFPGMSGTGPLAFGSFAFDPDHSAQESLLIVPEVIIGRRGDICWVTWVSCDDSFPDVLPRLEPPAARPTEVSWGDGALTGPAWESVVAEVVRRIRAGEADKVVLARDLIASTREPLDARWLVDRLVRTYADCWTYLVDGLVGATPEMLVRRTGRLALSRVLAGTIRRASGDAENTARLAAALTSSSKDVAEHEFAVVSVAEALAPFCSGVHVPESPYVLSLPNVMHLATDVTGVVDASHTSLALAAALHPSAAVCGTPTHVARELITELETLDRGRYAGPVGWIDAQGDGEWAIALRCGSIDPAAPNEIRIFAGCGIVADSVPEEELAETVAKFIPMRDALSL
ncbi:MAG TPA: isochorismate synthase [Propionibacteriaceae bacterium]|nr:isochorismate synthase [Propionibacteriaceae bacterium]